MIRHPSAPYIVIAFLAAVPAQAQKNATPTAVLDAPQVIPYGAALQLSGARSSDADGRVTRYVWTRIEGSGGGMPINQPVGTLEANFTVPQPAGQALAIGRHRFRLFVNDDSGNQSLPTEVQVMVVDNIAPTAVLDAPNASPVGAALQLSGARSSDTAGHIVRYTWTRMEGTGGGMPLNQPVVTEAATYVVPQPAGNALAIGRHQFRLVVTDDSGNQSSPVAVAVIVMDNQPPTASLDAPKQVLQMQPFELSAARSTDVGGRITRYEWLRLSGSAAGPMPLSQPLVTDRPALVVPQSPTSYLGVGKHLFRLIVVDDSGNRSPPADFPVGVIAPLPSGRSP